MKPYIFFIFLGLMFLLGCPLPPTCIEATDIRSNNLTLKLLETCGSEHPATVYSVSFFSRTRSVELWRIEVINHQEPMKLSEIIYGVVPNGFAANSAINLKRGEIIEVSVYKLSRYSGGSTPIVLSLK